MAKRVKKPPKKREQPWMAAAREKLRAKARMSEDPEISEAFMALASPAIDSLGARASAAEVLGALELVKFAWNLPILHALPTEPGSDGARVRAEAEIWLAKVSECNTAVAALCRARADHCSHLRRPVVQVFARAVDDRVATGLRAGEEVDPEAILLDVGDDGWPMVSHSLFELSRPVRDLWPEVWDDAAANEAFELAVVAWNLPVVDRPDAAVSDDLRRETREGARRALDGAPAQRAAFERMVSARRTRFAYDPRLIAPTSVRFESGMLWVDGAGLFIEGGAVDEEGD